MCWAALAERDMLDGNLKVRTMVLPDIFMDHDKPDRMYAKAGLDAAGITAQVMKALGRPDRALERRQGGLR